MDKQKHLEKIAQECIRELAYLQVPIGDVKEIKVNTRAKRRWGYFRKKPDGYYYIDVNAVLCDGEHDEGLKNTLYHELIHTCPGCGNHGKKWKHWAQVVSDHTKNVIKRTNSPAEKGVEDYVYTSKHMPVKYIFVCQNCGQKIIRKRESKFTRNYQMYRCGKCFGLFERIYDENQKGGQL